MNKVVSLAVLMFIFLNSKGQNIVGYSFGSNDGKSIDSFYIEIPAGYKCKIIDNPHAQTKFYRYPDGCIIFVSDSYLGGDNFEDIASAHNRANPKYSFCDTMTLFGVSDNGYYWEQKKYKNFLVGYITVPLNKVDYYHKIISNVNIKKLPLLE